MTKVYSKTDKYGNIFWYKEGTTILHREDGAAVEYFNGNKYWYQYGLLHRKNGPAIEFSNGDKCWYQNGLCHRVDGPAMESPNEYKSYFLNGKDYPDIQTDEEWLIFQIVN